jgi:hypothetical protein
LVLLHTGDTVKVKVGWLGIEGTVVEVLLHEESVVIDFGEEEEDGQRMLETHPISKCTKVYSTRFPKMSFDAAARSILLQLKGTTAFTEPTDEETIVEAKEV